MSRSIVFLCVVFAFSMGVPSAEEPWVLKPGVSVEHTLRAGEKHVFRVEAREGDYLHAIVAERGIDVVATLYGPSGEEIVQCNREDAEGREQVFWIAEIPGEHRLEVRPFVESARAGGYEIGLEALRPSTAEDRERVRAQRLFFGALALHARSTEAARRQALERFAEAEALFEAFGEPFWQANVLNETGMVYDALSETSRALEVWERALELYRVLGHAKGRAVVLNNLGSSHQNAGRFAKAEELFRRSLPLRREAGDLVGEAYTLNNLAGIEYLRGELLRAIDSFDKALGLFRIAGDPRGLALTLSNLGFLHFELDRPELAREFFRAALPSRRQIGDLAGEGTTLNNLGLIHRRFHDLAGALEHFRRALALYRRAGDRRKEATALENVASVLDREGRSHEALDIYREALELSREIGDPRLEARILASFGSSLGRSGALREASKHQERALEIARELELPLVEARIGLKLGATLLARGDLPAARARLEDALSGAREMGVRSLEGLALLELARLERREDHLPAARSHAEEVLEILESLRTGVASRELRESFWAGEQEPLRFYADLAMEEARRGGSRDLEVAAFEASERLRARSLSDLLVEAGAEIRRGVSPELLARERSLAAKLNEREYFRLKLLESPADRTRRAAVEKEISELLGELHEVEARIRAESPRYASLVWPQPLSLGEIRERVLDPETVLLEYLLGEARSFLWVVSPDGLTSFELPGRAEIEEAARRFHALVSNPDVWQTSVPAELEAARLGEMLVAPAAEFLGSRRLAIVGDGALHYVPFGALTDPRSGEPLLAEHEVVRLGSASALAMQRRGQAGRRPAPKALAVVADPVFQNDDPRVAERAGETARENEEMAALGDGLRRAREDLGLDAFERLRFTREEARRIADFLPAGEAFQALDFDASRERVLGGELGPYRWLHFATHGLLNSRHPELSGLVFSLVDERGHPRDGFVRAHEIYDLELSADVVVLSACRTALGKEIRGEGLVGLTRGFTYAGVPSVVVSLWDVDDRATAALMEAFYRAMLSEGLPPAAALRRAQNALRREPRWRPEYFWAGFELQGDWR